MTVMFEHGVLSVWPEWGGALRHGPVTDEQNFVFKFQHGKNILARHFVRIFLRYKNY